MRLRFRFRTVLIVIVVSLLLIGCVGLIGSGAGLSLVAFLAVALGIEQSDTWTRGDGYWVPCCQVGGVVGSCFCRTDATCNYADFMICDDGTCNDGAEGCPDGDAESVDAEKPDIRLLDDEGPDAGTWEPCCKDGVVDSCFCPAGMACNYGIFDECSDGSCVVGAGTCPGGEGAPKG